MKTDREPEGHVTKHELHARVNEQNQTHRNHKWDKLVTDGQDIHLLQGHIK